MRSGCLPAPVRSAGALKYFADNDIEMKKNP
jgi:hypothetical protein